MHNLQFCIAPKLVTVVSRYYGGASRIQQYIQLTHNFLTCALH